MDESTNEHTVTPNSIKYHRCIICDIHKARVEEEKSSGEESPHLVDLIFCEEDSVVNLF